MQNLSHRLVEKRTIDLNEFKDISENYYANRIIKKDKKQSKESSKNYSVRKIRYWSWY